MLNALRWKLVAVYFASAIGVVLLLMSGMYLLLSHYFLLQADLALQYKMAGEFQRLGISLPSELQQAVRTWQHENPGTALHATESMQMGATVTPTNSMLGIQRRVPDSQAGYTQEDDEEGESDSPIAISPVTLSTPSLPQTDGNSGDDEIEEEERFDNRLSAIFVVPMRQPSAQSSNLNLSAPISLDQQAAVHALASGYDLRTVLVDSGERVRLLTYRIESSDGDSIIQLGVLLKNQDSVLSQYLVGLALLGIAASLLVALISWLMAGRAIRPAQLALDQQHAFIANASHELRTPLAIIRANTEMGLRSRQPSEKKDAFHNVLAETDHMGLLVEDLLLLSRLDAHQVRIQLEPVDVIGLWQEVKKQMTAIMSDKGGSLQLTATPATALADRTRLRQVFLILLDNALRHNKPGNRIEVENVMDGNSVLIRVRDHGTGIAIKDLPHVFDRFYQGIPSDQDDRGTGLGLSIAKGLVEAQGGRIHAASAPGDGTVFIVRLPKADKPDPRHPLNG